MTAKTNTQSKVELSKKRQSPMPEQTESNQQQLTSFELGAIIQRMQDVPGKLAPGSAQKLQHTIGNQVMGRLFTRTPSRHSVHTPSIATSLQRMLAARGIQAKLTVNAPDDQYEQEADAAAKHVVSTINAPKAPPQTTQRQEEDDDIQMKPLPVISSLQRQEDEELQLKPIIQRQEEDEQIMTKPMLQRGDYGAGGHS